MQKFVIKKISRSTNVLISSTEEQNVNQVQQNKPTTDEKNLENKISSSVKMCGYLKKKRNFGGWQKLFFVLQNSLLMSYNSKEEYEQQLKSFKDVILIIPGNTVLLPSLEPRFTIASNLNTFYTFRCDDNKTCSKWIHAILECLSRDISMEFTGKSSSPTSSSSSSGSVKNFFSQQNLNINNSNGISSHRSKCSKYSVNHRNHSWENLQGSKVNNNNNITTAKNSNSNWIVNHNGRILLELNMLNCNHAKLPIASQTAKILKNCTENDVIRTMKKINFVQNNHNNDENQNFIHNGNNSEIKVAHDTHHHFHEKPDQFRLHNDSIRKQSREVNRISKMFPTKAVATTTKTTMKTESESQCSENLKLTQCNGLNEIGTEEQEEAMSFYDEEYSMFTTGDYASVDSARFNNKLNIEDTYSEIARCHDENDYAIPKKLKNNCNNSNKWIKTDENSKDLPEYSVVDLTKKYQERLKKVKQKELNGNLDENNEDEKVNNLIKNLNIYEDIEIVKSNYSKKNDEANIYELIEIREDRTRKSVITRSLLWKNLSRMHIFDFAKRFNSTSSSAESSSSSKASTSSDTIRKRQKYSLTLSNFSRHFNYNSMRNKAKKIYRKSNSTSAIPNSAEFDIVVSSASSLDRK